MPPPQDTIRTPDRKSSSSALLGTFKNLLVTRRSQPTISTPPPASHSSGDHESNSDVVDADLKNGRTDVVVAPVELSQQLELLGLQQGLGTRTAAAHKICTLLSEYPVRNIAGIWQSAQDLLDESNAPTGPTAGYGLLLALAKCPDITSLERRMILQAIQKVPRDERLEERFGILQELSHNGRDVDVLEGSLGGLLNYFLKNSYDIVVDARRKNKLKLESSAKEELLCSRVFHLVVDVTKFNSRILTKDDITTIVEQVITFCKRTNVQSDISNSILVMDALVTYNTVPDRPLRSWLALLADIYRQLEVLHTQAWGALANIFKSHLGHTATSALLLALRCDTKQEPDRNFVRAAFRVLADLVHENGKEGLPKLSLSVFIPAVKSSLAIDRKKHDADVLHFIADLQANEPLRRAIMEENLIKDAGEIILHCAGKISPHEMNGNGTGAVPVNGRESVPLEERDGERVDQALRRILNSINDRFGSFDLVHKSELAQMMLGLCNRLSNPAIETLLDYISVERLLFPSDSQWKSSCKTLIRNVLRDPSRPTPTRIRVFDVLKDSFLTIDSIRDDDSANSMMDSILQSIPREKDTALLERIVGLAVEHTDHTTQCRFEGIIGKFASGIFESGDSAKATLEGSADGSIQSNESGNPKSSPSYVLAKGVVRMFMRNLNRHGDRTLKLYDLILHIASSDNVPSDARIMVFKLLFRLRADSSYSVFIETTLDVESVARVLGRTAERVEERRPDPSPLQRHTSSDKNASSKDSHRKSSILPLASKDPPTSPPKPLPKLWLYPDPEGLPDELASRSSPLIRVGSASSREMERQNSSVLDISQWLEIAVSILLHQPDWELYTYVLVHLGTQLANKTLFHGSAPQIQLLRSVISEQIRNKSFMDPPPSTGLKKGDVAVCLFHILTMLLGYNEHFSKNEEDDIVRTFISGIGSWDRTSKWCIHAMSICCHELPLSMSKVLDTIIQKMAQIITQQPVSVHILEFLAGLARMPELYKNFREDEYRMVFGVCFRYLQSVRDKQEKENLGVNSGRTVSSGTRQSGSSKDSAAASGREQRYTPNPHPEDLPQYVYVKTFHVITYWFMALKMQDRVSYMSWIAKNLTYTDSSGQPFVEDQGLVTVDMMQRVTYSDRDETKPNPHFASVADGLVSTKTWIVGMSLMSIETAGRTGLSQITRRRPTGNRYSIFRPQMIDPPRHQVHLTTGLAADVFYRSEYVGVLPDDVLQDFYSPLSMIGTDQPELIPLPDDDAIRRAISSLDRIPVLDGHKVGVIYIGPGQTEEKDILANTSGSADYTEFIARLGTLTKLKNCQLNTQGLDREFDTDGEHAILWRDRVSEIVFHVTTLMPTNLEHDPHCVNKKRHIGNDFVNIIWNASGQPFNFNTFPSAFNYAYIVINPESRPSTLGSTTSSPAPSSTDPSKPFYTIHLVSSPSFPKISPASQPKLISTKSLPSLARLLALNASVFSLVWASREGGEYVSSWRARLQQIRALRERMGAGKGAGPGAGFLNAATPLSTTQVSARRIREG
ncbi:hypothetical protein P152DRAFT_138750 [Eremomyces bilateralis CBS 781.70]|uniref:Rap-GAP domain-containing protein n=1 Tax=Eremomyces bilateralis CBS 781.70 TaxID=1392243 RepID=A0A6G1FWE0_9PEZI|nr:uncharacterized protein P152DRAFT_138750 [Eremomyces bilateralis CBS 781.70]KAF1810048.1 hypothetical protein P152DRAFT_138750 [Eremomyces bilateralis CBS 781.70]